jgi:hypothetical protein
MNLRINRSFNKKLYQPKALYVIRAGVLKTLKRCNITCMRIWKRARGALRRQTKVFQANIRRVADTMNRQEGAVDLKELSIQQPSI